LSAHGEVNFNELSSEMNRDAPKFFIATFPAALPAKEAAQAPSQQSFERFTPHAYR
jgi:hypothetical protein